MNTERMFAAQRGFTLIELIASLTLIALLASIVAPRFFDQRVFNERGYADELAASLRHAQRVAIASNCPVRFTSNAAGYTAVQRAAVAGVCSGAWTLPVPRTDGTPLAGVAPNDVAANPAVQIEFDPAGAPTAAMPAVTIGSFTLTVDAVTGRTAVTP